jgi:5-methylcytosine-specific restriction endonuclease McrA
MPLPVAVEAAQPTMSDGLRATVDHKTPLSRGRTWRWGNIVLACARCNHTKGNMRPAEWERFMRQNPTWWQ